MARADLLLELVRAGAHGAPMATLKSPTCGRVKIPRRQGKISY